MNEHNFEIGELVSMLEPARVERLREVIEHRTESLVVVLEILDKGHNQSAILRTCDSFGVHTIHLVQGSRRKFRPTKGMTQGVHKWMNLHQHTDTLQAAQQLKEEGYSLWASNLNPNAKQVWDVDFTGKTAILFGNEVEGVSPETQAICDGSFYIPMFGFSQSYNVSVAAAITLYEASRQRLHDKGQLGDLSPDQKESLMHSYATRSLPRRVLRELQRRISCNDPKK